MGGEDWRDNDKVRVFLAIEGLGWGRSESDIFLGLLISGVDARAFSLANAVI
jgi:hypothetical protein